MPRRFMMFTPILMDKARDTMVVKGAQNSRLMLIFILRLFYFFLVFLSDKAMMFCKGCMQLHNGKKPDAIPGAGAIGLYYT